MGAPIPLPGGGTGHRRPEWDDAALIALADRFLGSPFGAPHDNDDGHAILESLLWFGPGDPLRWSPVAVEMLLLDWVPRKIVADAGLLLAVPEVLRSFVRFSHHERGIRAELTAETLAAVEDHEPGYRRLIVADRRRGPAAFPASVLDEDDLDDDPVTTARIVLERLARAVGDEALDRLDTRPLPDEPFDRDTVPPDVRVAAGDPRIFRRRSRAGTTAAAVVWVIGKANTLFGAGGMRVKDMTEHFGAPQSVSQRAAAMLTAVGVDSYQFGEMDLGSPDLLVSGRRSEIVALRDRYRGDVE